MHVRPATSTDVPAIQEIYNEAILSTTGTAEYETVSLASRQKWFGDRVAAGYPVLVYDDGEVRGYAALSAWVAREGYRFTAETAVYVAQGSWGRGIGTELMAALVEAARERGYRSLVARVAVENPASLRAHFRQGFIEVGRMPQVFYKFGRWVDIVMLQLLLASET